MPKVILLGDSTLDNYYWVQNELTVTDHLSSILSNMQVINYAVDGFTTNSILYGEYKDFEVISPRHTHEYFKPLETLKKEQDVEHIVLSVLGNDFRVELSELIFMEPEARLQAINQLIARITSNYVRVVEEIKEVQPNAKLSLVLQYTPYLKSDPYLIYFLMDKLSRKESVSKGLLSYIQIKYYSLFGLNNERQREAIHLLQELMAKIYRNIFNELGKQMSQESFAIIDLSSSFDYRDSDSYKSQIEPSEKGGKLIASLISHAITRHDFKSESMLYAQHPSQSIPVTLEIPLAQLKNVWFPGSIFTNKEQALSVFKQAYQEQLSRDKASFCGLYGFFARSNVNFEHITLEELLSHAQSCFTKKTGFRTLRVMQNLGWLTEQGDIKEESGLGRLLVSVQDDVDRGMAAT
ncbi:SGNH/GDSL hydrolase family protein [Legionella shakespearei]|uniref:GDSL-like Lipase/Acylhydrolase n=1 Tax=Legionella shakespearei DSM 23087 TaxID=1122169 RepID=A0A0W0Z7L6_9GAMM|nr:SGNH/GDSL hydrolase family protein [Legionella shakespearei]KTD64942.1 GDSL-like Lipase/Acylhydrolase [Legionella shakespearei DSM 23087]